MQLWLETSLKDELPENLKYLNKCSFGLRHPLHMSYQTTSQISKTKAMARDIPYT